jgi:hypothetical protein
MKIYHMDVWIKTNDPMFWRERLLDLADSMDTEIDFSDPMEEKHMMPSEIYDDETIYYPTRK